MSHSTVLKLLLVAITSLSLIACGGSSESAPTYIPKTNYGPELEKLLGGEYYSFDFDQSSVASSNSQYKTINSLMQHRYVMRDNKLEMSLWFYSEAGWVQYESYPAFEGLRGRSFGANYPAQKKMMVMTEDGWKDPLELECALSYLNERINIDCTILKGYWDRVIRFNSPKLNLVSDELWRLAVLPSNNSELNEIKNKIEGVFPEDSHLIGLDGNYEMKKLVSYSCRENEQNAELIECPSSFDSESFAELTRTKERFPFKTRRVLGYGSDYRGEAELAGDLVNDESGDILMYPVEWTDNVEHGQIVGQWKKEHAYGMDIIVFPVGSNIDAITEYNNKIIIVSYEAQARPFSLYLYEKNAALEMNKGIEFIVPLEY